MYKTAVYTGVDGDLQKMTVTFCKSLSTRVQTAVFTVITVIIDLFSVSVVPLKRVETTGTPPC